MRYDAFKRFTKHFDKRGPLVPRFPLTRTLGPLGVTANGAARWYLAGGISASACVAAYQPKGAASLAASYINLANPGTYDAAPGVAPTWASSTGWTFNGTSQYLKTGIVPSTGWSAIIRFDSLVATGSFQYLLGMDDAAGKGFHIAADTTLSANSWRNPSAINYSRSAGAGVLAMNATTAFVDGSAVPGSFSGTVPSVAVFVGARNRLGEGLGAYTKGNIVGAAIYNVSLSAAQIGAVTAAMQAL